MISASASSRQIGVKRSLSNKKREGFFLRTAVNCSVLFCIELYCTYFHYNSCRLDHPRAQPHLRTMPACLNCPQVYYNHHYILAMFEWVPLNEILFQGTVRASSMSQSTQSISHTTRFGPGPRVAGIIRQSSLSISITHWLSVGLSPFPQ